MPGQSAVRETLAPGLIHGIYDAARRIEAQRADPQAKDQHRPGAAAGADTDTSRPALTCTCHCSTAFPASLNSW